MLEIEAVVQRPGEPVQIAMRCLSLLHGAACIGRFDAVTALGKLAERLGISRARVHEAALQVVPYGGYPRAIEALTRVSSPTRSPGDGAAPDRGGADAGGTPTGARVFEAVYGDQAEPVRRALDRLSPGLSRQVVEDAYGRVLARSGLEVQERELLAVASLALMALPSPLDSHVRGALRNGSTPQAVMDILDSCRVLASPEALSVIARVRDRLQGTHPEP
ncbi:MAG: carboxymuconolactone decarboxylase family protein [Planctomycetota bacterium]|jgi:4-carboxymuconolactone decarboxylase